MGIGMNGYKKGQKKRGRPRKSRTYFKECKTEKPIIIDQILEKLFYGDVNSKGQVVRKNLKDLCVDYNIPQQTFYYYVHNHKHLREKYQKLKMTRKMIVADYREDNISNALQGKGKFSDMEAKDVARLSLDVLKSTDKGYIPKLDVESKSMNLDLSVSMDELMKKFEELKNNN